LPMDTTHAVFFFQSLSLDYSCRHTFCFLSSRSLVCQSRKTACQLQKQQHMKESGNIQENRRPYSSKYLFPKSHISYFLLLPWKGKEGRRKNPDRGTWWVRGSLVKLLLPLLLEPGSPKCLRAFDNWVKCKYTHEDEQREVKATGCIRRIHLNYRVLVKLPCLMNTIHIPKQLTIKLTWPTPISLYPGNTWTLRPLPPKCRVPAEFTWSGHQPTYNLISIELP
jgi:hypothetical protein